jgi:hypothetical protein
VGAPTTDAVWRGEVLGGFQLSNGCILCRQCPPVTLGVTSRHWQQLTHPVQTDSVFLDARTLCTYTQRCFLCHPLCACRPWMNVLLLAAPFALIGYGAGWSNGVVFAFALLAIAPFAERLGFVTEQLAFHTNETRE